MLIHNMMYLSYGYIINDIIYQCCAYSYSFEKIYIKYRFKMDAKTNENIYVRFCARFMI